MPDGKIQALAGIFKAVSDPTRMKILLSLEEGELCVCDVSQVLGMSLSAVSHQLRVLRNLRLVKYRNAGRMAFYSLEDSRLCGFPAGGDRKAWKMYNTVRDNASGFG